jgi:hypothetical protein
LKGSVENQREACCFRNELETNKKRKNDFKAVELKEGEPDWTDDEAKA